MEFHVSRIRTLRRFAGIFSAACGGGLIQNPQPYKVYKHLRLGSACCGLPGVSGTVQTTRHIEWILAIREDHPLAIEYEGAICTSSHSRLYRSRCILRRRNLPGRQLPPHLLNPPDPSYRARHMS
jgi:hypothetical protein